MLDPCLWQQSAAGCLKIPILGPTGALSPKVSLKNEFSQDTHLPCRVPTWSFYNTNGVAPLRLAPVSGNEFSLGTHQAGRLPTWSLYNTHGVTPCAWPRSQATLGSYPCSYIVRTPPPDSCTHSLPKKRVFPGYTPTLQGTHMVPLQHPWGRIPALGPCL